MMLFLYNTFVCSLNMILVVRKLKGVIMDNKIKRLELIQGVITRMTSNSFLLKVGQLH